MKKYINEDLTRLSAERRRKWKIACRKMAFEVNDTVICEKHFIKGKPADLKNKDDPDWVPTLNMGAKSHQQHSTVTLEDITIKEENDSDMEIGEENITDFNFDSTQEMDSNFEFCRLCSNKFHKDELKSLFLPYNGHDLTIFAEFVLGIKVKIIKFHSQFYSNRIFNYFSSSLWMVILIPRV